MGQDDVDHHGPFSNSIGFRINFISIASNADGKYTKATINLPFWIAKGYLRKLSEVQQQLSMAIFRKPDSKAACARSFCIELEYGF